MTLPYLFFPQTSQPQNQMSTKRTAKKPAAKAAPRAAKAAKTKPAPKAPKPAPDAGAEPRKRHERILGHSACAVARALGQAGVKLAEADAIMRAHGVGMSKGSLSVQLGFGRNPKTWETRGEPAPLTAAEIKDLRAGVQP